MPQDRVHAPLARRRHRALPLPLLISVSGELLGPILQDDESQSATWYIVSESDVDLPRLVASVAGLLILSPFEA